MAPIHLLRISLIGITFVILMYLITYTSISKVQNDENGDGFQNRLRGPVEADDEKLLELLKTKFMSSPSKEDYNLSSDPFYKETRASYSWPFIYSFTRKLFRNQTGGFFVEAGALDGEYLSNTLWLEKEQNWTGLLIEPDPFNYQELVLKRRKAWSSNSCISSKPYPKKTVLVSTRKQKFTGGYNSWVYRGASYELGYTLSANSDPFFRATTPTYVRVQCFPLASYLLALNRTKVDFLSLDVQGSEEDIIKTLPFDKLRFRVVVVEHLTPRPFDFEFVAYFAERSFHLVGCGGEQDYIFVSKEDFDVDSFKKVSSCLR